MRGAEERHARLGDVEDNKADPLSRAAIEAGHPELRRLDEGLARADHHRRPAFQFEGEGNLDDIDGPLMRSIGPEPA